MEEQYFSTGEQGVVALTEGLEQLQELIDTLSLQVADYERVLRWYNKQVHGIRGPAKKVLEQWSAPMSEEM